MNIGRKTRAARSPKWAAFAKRFLKGKCCAACGRSEHVVAHHKQPFHLHPELELDESNLIPLCEGRAINCHLAIGHLYFWPSFNPTVDADAAYIAKRVKERP